MAAAGITRIFPDLTDDLLLNLFHRGAQVQWTSRSLDWNTPLQLSDRQRLALDALTDCAAEHGKRPPGSFGLPAGLVAVELDQWRDELRARGALNEDAANPRQDFRRLKNSLQARKLIGARENLVWRT